MIKNETYLAYFDETGDDGNNTASSTHFILTSIYFPASKYRDHYSSIRLFRQRLKETYGFPMKMEFHTKNFLMDKDPYRVLKLEVNTRKAILSEMIEFISTMEIDSINVCIDKTKIDVHYNVLDNALKYSIQRIENHSKKTGMWNYVIISDEGRISSMRKTARMISAYNTIPSQFTHSFKNVPIKNQIEDILGKDSSESYFIQICDFISFFIHLYIKVHVNGQTMNARIKNVMNKEDITQALDTFLRGGILNLSASKDNKYGIVIYPK